MYRPSLIVDLLQSPTGFLSFFLNVGFLFLCVALFIVVDFLFDKYDKLGEIRWFICWPLIVVLFFVSGFLTDAFVKVVIWLPLRDFGWVGSVVNVLSPILHNLLAVPISFYFLYRLIPRKQHYFMAGWLFLSVLIVGFGFTVKSISIGDFLHSFIYLSNVAIAFLYYRKRLSLGDEVEGNPFNYYCYFFRKTEKK